MHSFSDHVLPLSLLVLSVAAGVAAARAFRFELLEPSFSNLFVVSDLI